MTFSKQSMVWRDDIALELTQADSSCSEAVRGLSRLLVVALIEAASFLASLALIAAMAAALVVQVGQVELEDSSGDSTCLESSGEIHETGQVETSARLARAER